MFHELLESGARSPRRTGWAAASTGVHALIIATVAALTVRESLPAMDRPIEIIRLAAPRPMNAPAAPATPRSLVQGRFILPDVAITMPSLPAMRLPTDFVPQTAFAPTERLAGGGPGLFSDAFHRRPIAGDIYSDMTVERAVMPRPDNPQPEYPSALRAASVEGSVLVQFVVDTAGRVEPRSVTILRTTHESFSVAVRRWLARTRYAPAQVGGAAVRQRVQQEVGFTLTR